MLNMSWKGMGRMTLDACMWLVVNTQLREKPTSEGIENLTMLERIVKYCGNSDTGARMMEDTLLIVGTTKRSLTYV